MRIDTIKREEWQFPAQLISFQPIGSHVSNLRYATVLAPAITIAIERRKNNRGEQIGGNLS